MLYLHETIDIAGTGQDAYVAAVVQRAAHSEKVGLSRLVGCWRVVGSTGRWPQVVNLWEMDGWAHWADGLERQFLPDKRDAHLGPWWTAVAEWRRGGFDRILVPAAGCPTHADLVASAARAWVCEQTITRARAGCATALVDATIEVLAPLLARQRIRLLGAYTVPMRDDEIVTLTAAPTFAELCGWYERRVDEPRWRRWRDSAREWIVETESVWLVPGEGTLLRSA